MNGSRPKIVDAAVDLWLDVDRGQQLLLQVIPEFRSGAWQLLSYEITEVRRHHSKLVVFAHVYYHDEPHRRAGMAKIIASTYSDEQGAKAMRALQRLWAAGFRPPSRYRVPRPYGYSEELGILLQAAAPGMVWADFLQGTPCSLARASARAAAWLIHLQRIPVRGEAGAWLDLGSSAGRQAWEIARALPQHSERLESVVERMVPRLCAHGMPAVCSHGDYHPKNVFLDPALTTVIDFDAFGLREAAFDVGCCIGQLLHMSHSRTGDLAPGASAALAFWHRYSKDGQAPWPRVAAHVARTLLDVLHYVLCGLRVDSVELLTLSTALMEAWLDSDGPGILERLILGASRPAVRGRPL